jgi:hypothetical protein
MAKRRPIINALKVRELWGRSNARAEIRRRVKKELGIDVTTLRELLDLFVEFAPQILKIIMQVIDLFS